MKIGFTFAKSQYYESSLVNANITCRIGAKTLALAVSILQGIGPFLQSSPNDGNGVPNTFGWPFLSYSRFFSLPNSGERIPNHPKYWNNVKEPDASPTSALLTHLINKIICKRFYKAYIFPLLHKTNVKLLPR